VVGVVVGVTPVEKGVMPWRFPSSVPWRGAARPADLLAGEPPWWWLQVGGRSQEPFFNKRVGAPTVAYLARSGRLGGGRNGESSRLLGGVHQ
jgi:hypothetical protein